jgi:hypothetical protein
VSHILLCPCVKQIADVLGINLGGIIEEFSYKLGIPEPKLSGPQSNMVVTRITAVRCRMMMVFRWKAVVAVVAFVVMAAMVVSI